MRKKLALAVSSIGLCLSAFAADMSIVSIDSDGMGAVAKGDEVLKGTSGVVIKKINEGKSTVAAKAIAMGSGKEIKVRFEVFEALAQPALPRPIVRPQVGDGIVFGAFNNRATVIAKNQADYQKAVSSDQKEWVHPDLFASILIRDRDGAPNRAKFAEFCDAYSVGQLYFPIMGRVYVADCQSMEVVKEYALPTDQSSEFESPFFKRTGEVETGYLGMMKTSVKDYEPYYLRLIGR